MTASAKEFQETIPAKETDEADVLYQRLGDQWYAFSLIDNEMFFAKIEDKILNEI